MFTILILLLFQGSPKFLDNNHTLFSQKESFYVFKKDSLYKFNKDEWSGTKHNLNLKNYNFNVIEDNGNVFLIAKGGGMVLSFNNEKLEVISNSSFWDSNFESFNFFRNGTLFSYGGYGHFNTRDNLIFFDKDSKEWFDIKLNQNGLDSRRHQVIGSYNNKTEAFYIGLGKKDKYLYSDILRYDFKTKEWNKYADIGKLFGSDYRVIPNYKSPLIIYKGQKITFDFLNKTYNIYEDESSAINSFIQIHYNSFTNQFLISKKK
jgi:hypothetical protein